uniref:Uncharacterized protein n=1 Tax=Rhizophora mucronata TaxID=61149 RepID=A0A2P2JFB9_RHIMU
MKCWCCFRFSFSFLRTQKKKEYKIVCSSDPAVAFFICSNFIKLLYFSPQFPRGNCKRKTEALDLW